MEGEEIDQVFFVFAERGPNFYASIVWGEGCVGFVEEDCVVVAEIRGFCAVLFMEVEYVLHSFFLFLMKPLFYF